MIAAGFGAALMWVGIVNNTTGPVYGGVAFILGGLVVAGLNHMERKNS